MQNRQFRLTSTFLLFLFSLSVSGCFFAQSSLKQTSVVATDYQKLEQLLDQDNWREADLETFNKLLIIANRQEEGWLSVKDVENIPCEDLATINRLWQKYSRRRFGFRVQTRIWESVGGKPGQYDSQIALKMGEIVGWQEEGQWKNYNDLNFTAKANPGHLPATTGNGVSGGVWGGVATIASRVQACSSSFDNLPKALQKAAAIEVQQNQAEIQSGNSSCVGCNLVGADLQGVDLALGNLAYADLRKADLRGAILGGINLSLADLRGANLEGAILRQADLWAASLDEANLAGADFSCGAGSCTYLQGASFQNANLTSADLYCLDCSIIERRGLENVNLASANLTDAVIENTSLQGVNLCDAILPDGTRSQQGCQ